MKIICFFNNIDDTKNAFGQIKKENWNKANLAVLFTEAAPQTQADANYELAAENFSQIPPSPDLVWPGVKETSIAGVGAVYLGSNFKNSAEINQIAEKYPELKEQLTNHKIVTLVEVPAEFAQRVKEVLESNGAEIIKN